ncbi:MAG: aromatic amino acid lyase, partial [Candidatus Hodarchaeales archaeon]
VSENRTLSHPASVDSIPVSAAQEDVVSMGTIAGRKAMTIVNNTFNVLSIELLAAAQALDFAGVSKAGAGTRAAHKFIRSIVPTLEEDRVFQGDIAKISESLKSSKFINAVEKTSGELK